MAGAPAAGNLRSSVYGRHPFPCAAEGQIVKKAVYFVLGLDMEGRRDVLGMYIGENESSKFWLAVLNNVKKREIEDMLIVSVDGLTGFPDAIEAVYPNAEIQKGVIHRIRNTTRFVSYTDIKPLMADHKRIYAAVDEPAALAELDRFEELWGKKYPATVQSWRSIGRV